MQSIFLLLSFFSSIFSDVDKDFTLFMAHLFFWRKQKLSPNQKQHDECNKACYAQNQEYRSVGDFLSGGCFAEMNGRIAVTNDNAVYQL